MKPVCLTLAFAFVLLAAAGSRAAEAGALDAGVMKVALHTAAPEEDGFIDRVVDMVNRQILPTDLVESTFLWAKKKPRNKFQYFKHGLILRASQQGIAVH